MEFLVAGALYIIFLGSVFSFFQAVHRLDEEMRVITEQWIEETSSSTGP
jgi:hypothetical protein